MIILSVYVVSDTIKENTHRKFSILQDAIDNCPNDATIVIKVILRIFFHIVHNGSSISNKEQTYHIDVLQ